MADENEDPIYRPTTTDKLKEMVDQVEQKYTGLMTRYDQMTAEAASVKAEMDRLDDERQALYGALYNLLLKAGEAAEKTDAEALGEMADALAEHYKAPPEETPKVGKKGKGGGRKKRW